MNTKQNTWGGGMGREHGEGGLLGVYEKYDFMQLDSSKIGVFKKVREQLMRYICGVISFLYT